MENKCICRHAKERKTHTIAVAVAEDYNFRNNSCNLMPDVFYDQHNKSTTQGSEAIVFFNLPGVGNREGSS
jgi:hypothetical protein